MLTLLYVAGFNLLVFLLKTFIPIFIRDMGLSFSQPDIFDFEIKIIVISWNELKVFLSLLFFGKGIHICVNLRAMFPHL